MNSVASFPGTEAEHHQARLADAARLAALSATGLMDSLPEEAFDRIVRLARQATGLPVALFSVVDDRRQFLKAQSGLETEGDPVRETPLTSSFCQYVVTSDQPLAVNDSRAHPLLAENGAVVGLGVVAYLGTPVHAPDGQVIGTLCVIDHEPHDWTDAQLNALRDLAAIMETELVLRRTVADRALIMGELNHRLKNLFAIVAAMVRLSRRAHATGDALAADLETRVNALARAHRLIEPAAAIDNHAMTGVTLKELMVTLLAPYLGDGGRAHLQVEGDPVPLGGRAMTSLSLAFHEMATNSAKYGALSQPDPDLRIEWGLRDDVLRLVWVETIGQPVQPADSGGFGSKLLELTLEGQLHGQLQTEATDRGLRHIIHIPQDTLAR